MSLKFLRQTSSATRNSKRSESPLTIKLGLMVQSKKEKVTCGEISSRKVMCIAFKSTGKTRKYYEASLSAVPW